MNSGVPASRMPWRAASAGTADMREVLAGVERGDPAGGAAVQTLVVEAREDLEIARQVRAVVAA
jgi:hypothetical protein